ncbi:Protein S100-B [Aix galericulata]|nr:Protein S100-B [Aix galericulata]
MLGDSPGQHAAQQKAALLLDSANAPIACLCPQDCTATMSELEKAMIAVIDAFHQYSGKEGDKHKLKKSELKELINNELPHFLGEIKDQETVDKVMEALDSNGDAECDFQEFVAFIAMVTAACHEFFEHE